MTNLTDAVRRYGGNPTLMTPDEQAAFVATKDFIQQGDRIRVPMQFADADRVRAIEAACDARNAQRDRDDALAKYYARVADGLQDSRDDREAAHREYIERVTSDAVIRGSQSLRDEAQREYCERITNSWSTRATPVSDQSATDPREAAYRDYANFISNSWQGNKR